MRCLNPFYIKDLDQQVPCGKCQACLGRRASGWSFRLAKQIKVCHSAHFVTLTFNTSHVPISVNGYMTLAKRPFQLFMKRLRKMTKHDHKLSYYMCGEYGSQKKRPHYHVILFNSDPLDIVEAWKIDGQCIGNIKIGTVGPASIGYCLKYMCKEPMRRKHRNDDRLPEFSLMSKGLGKNYLTRNMVNWHKADLLNRVHLNLEDGKKCAMPRYYKLKMYTEEEREQIAYHFQKLYSEELEEFNKKPDADQLRRDYDQAVRASYRRMYQDTKQTRIL